MCFFSSIFVKIFFFSGVSSLLSDGDVGGLLKSVTHGAANSAAKVFVHSHIYILLVLK